MWCTEGVELREHVGRLDQSTDTANPLASAGIQPLQQQISEPRRPQASPEAYGLVFGSEKQSPASHTYSPPAQSRRLGMQRRPRLRREGLGV